MRKLRGKTVQMMKKIPAKRALLQLLHVADIKKNYYFTDLKSFLC
jgi:hypothetical protein